MAFKKKTDKAQSRTPERKKLVKVGALWIHTGKEDERFMSGRIELTEGQEVQLLVFKNGYKEEDKHPDFVIYEAPAPSSRGRSSQGDDII